MKLKQLATAVILATGSCATLAATYSVTPLVTNDSGQNGFAQSIDNAGTTIMAIQDEFRPPIDVTLFDEDFFTDNANLTDPDAAAEGNFNDDDYLFMIGVLQTSRANNASQVQRLAEFRSYAQSGNADDVIPGLDVVSASTGNLSQSVRTIARDSVDGNYFVGASESPYLPLIYTNGEGNEIRYILSDIRQSAFVQVNDNTVRLAPTDTTLNGYSEAFGVNTNFQVAGFGTVDFSDGFDEAIANCEDEEERGYVPV